MIDDTRVSRVGTWADVRRKVRERWLPPCPPGLILSWALWACVQLALSLLNLRSSRGDAHSPIYSPGLGRCNACSWVPCAHGVMRLLNASSAYGIPYLPLLSAPAVRAGPHPALAPALRGSGLSCLLQAFSGFLVRQGFIVDCNLASISLVLSLEFLSGTLAGLFCLRGQRAPGAASACAGAAEAAACARRLRGTLCALEFGRQAGLTSTVNCLLSSCQRVK